MDILINKNKDYLGDGFVMFEIHRNEWCDANLSNEINFEFKTTKQRDGYMRKIIPLCCFIHGQSEYKFLQNLKTTKEQLYNFFNVPDNNDMTFLVKNVNPWICFTEDFDIVLYFGDDKPIIKEKTVKSNTKHRQTWAKSSKQQFNGTTVTYKYWDVKDNSKMIICSVDLKHLKLTFPDIEYQFDEYWSFQDNPKLPELILNEPFKATRDYDYSEEEKKEILEKERIANELKQQQIEEWEKRKNTPGYCSICGAEHAEYIPFEGRYLCHDCYWDSKY